MRIAQCELKEANDFVTEHHRHHKKVLSHRFSIRVVDGGGITRGVAIVGRPVCRHYDFRKVLEVTRLCTDGTKNACSILYAAAARIGRELGYETIQTYILDSESGTTLRAAGWEFASETRGHQWVRSDGSPRRTDQPTCDKQRWIRRLN